MSSAEASSSIGGNSRNTAPSVNSVNNVIYSAGDLVSLSSYNDL